MCQFFFIWQNIGKVKRNGSQFIAQIAAEILFFLKKDFQRSAGKLRRDPFYFFFCICTLCFILHSGAAQTTLFHSAWVRGLCPQPRRFASASAYLHLHLRLRLHLQSKSSRCKSSRCKSPRCKSKSSRCRSKAVCSVEQSAPLPFGEAEQTPSLKGVGCGGQRSSNSGV